MTCDRFITAKLVSNLALPHTETKLTVVVNMLMAGVAMPKGCDVQIR